MMIIFWQQIYDCYRKLYTYKQLLLFEKVNWSEDKTIQKVKCSTSKGILFLKKKKLSILSLCFSWWQNTEPLVDLRFPTVGELPKMKGKRENKIKKKKKNEEN